MESALDRGGEALDTALGCDLMLHAWMLSQSGVPVLYSGDEVGQLNDNAYHHDPDKAADSRYIHRGDFDWVRAEDRHVPGTVEQRLFDGLRQLERIRAARVVFRSDAAVSVLDAGADSVLAIERRYGADRFIGAYNFSPEPVALRLSPGNMTDLLTGEPVTVPLTLPGYGFLWLHN